MKTDGTIIVSFFGRLDTPQIRSKLQNRPKSGNIFVFPIWVVGTLNLCLLMLVTAKKESVFYVTTELGKCPTTVPFSLNLGKISESQLNFASN